MAERIDERLPLRDPVQLLDRGGVGVQAAWVAVFGALAWSRFTTADVSS